LAEARCLRAWIHANIFWNYGHWWGDDADKVGLLYLDEVIFSENALHWGQPLLFILKSE